MPLQADSVSLAFSSNKFATLKLQSGCAGVFFSFFFNEEIFRIYSRLFSIGKNEMLKSLIGLILRHSPLMHVLKL